MYLANKEERVEYLKLWLEKYQLKEKFDRALRETHHYSLNRLLKSVTPFRYSDDFEEIFNYNLDWCDTFEGSDFWMEIHQLWKRNLRAPFEVQEILDTKTIMGCWED